MRPTFCVAVNNPSMSMQWPKIKKTQRLMKTEYIYATVMPPC